MDISDIVKSVIYPLIYSTPIALLIYFIQFYFNENWTPFIIKIDENSSMFSRIFWIILKISYFVLLLYFALILKGIEKWTYFPYFFIPWMYFVTTKFIDSQPKLRSMKYIAFISFIFILLPIFSITSAKSNSIKIFHNHEYSYTIFDKQKLKFIGKASNHYVFTSFDNKNKYFIDLSELKILTLKGFKKKSMQKKQKNNHSN